jgi:hypothetical protein
MQLPAGTEPSPPAEPFPRHPAAGVSIRGGTVTPIQAMAAAAENDTGIPGLNLAQYGAIGILLTAFVWFAYSAWKRECARADRQEAEHRADRDKLIAENREERERLETENRRLHGDIQEKAIPALLASATALTEVTEMLREQQRARRYYEDARPARRDGEP